jgi:DNA-directed RNA polymerase sigma subunit (sigma70/sigma32)
MHLNIQIRETVMKVYTKENLLLEDNESELGLADGLHAPILAGTFSLRCAYYFAKTGKLLLSSSQQRALVNLVREADSEVKNEIIIHNLHKVVSLAKRYTNRGLEFFDLVREGNQGLIEALEKAESADGPRFSIYATWCICRSIERALLKQNNQPESYQPA